MNWYVFSTVPEDAEETLEVCGSYAEAVFLAQCAHDTTARPTRSGGGIYTLRNPQSGRGRYIATAKTMKQQGFGHLLTAENEMPRRRGSVLRHLSSK